LALVGAVLLGILLMHGGLSVLPLASQAAGMAPAADVMTASPADGMGAVAVAPGAAKLGSPPGCSGHAGAMCLADLRRGGPTLAGLILLVLALAWWLTGGRGSAVPLASHRPRGPPSGDDPPLTPSLWSLCVLRL
jgi:hypothetical protein